jgi:pimeloyl-ACP methyl ester carboxylesterase
MCMEMPDPSPVNRRNIVVIKQRLEPAETSPVPNTSNVRSRRAYFDCRHGQLHVRTAFPTTGGFDEKVTLVCLHAGAATGRQFTRFMPLAAIARSVYAPDLPGCGESDRGSAASPADAAAAVLDLVTDLRLRQVDLLAVREGAAVAVELARARPDLVRRVVLLGAAPSLQLPARVHLIDASNYPDDPFESDPAALAQLVDSYLSR